MASITPSGAMAEVFRVSPGERMHWWWKLFTSVKSPHILYFWAQGDILIDGSSQRKI